MLHAGVLAPASTALYPPTVKPPEQPLKLSRALMTYVRNPLLVLSPREQRQARTSPTLAQR